ncbi:hypothetical protein [Streptosporangium sp. NPDC049046]|uniref:hypothetical protein n=1 Tax=Streptosporangium sp. NPDC049046 TaxID=3155031 RepID=UPI00342065CD
MAQAKRHFDDLMSKIPEEQHAAVIGARRAHSWINLVDDADYANATCPTCGDDEASCFGREDFEVSVDVEPDGEGGCESYVDGGWRFLQAESLTCGACGLRLHNPGESEAAGLGLNVHMPGKEGRKMSFPIGEAHVAAVVSSNLVTVGTTAARPAMSWTARRLLNPEAMAPAWPGKPLISTSSRWKRR